MLGVPGLLWAGVFYWWYRDDPAEHLDTNEAERSYIRGGAASGPVESHPPLPWRQVLTSVNIWLLGGIVSCGSFTTYLFFFWYPTYLKRGRGVDPDSSSWMTGLASSGERSAASRAVT